MLSNNEHLAQKLRLVFLIITTNYQSRRGLLLGYKLRSHETAIDNLISGTRYG